jgi:hypothetical protein
LFRVVNVFLFVGVPCSGYIIYLFSLVWSVMGTEFLYVAWCAV